MMKLILINPKEGLDDTSFPLDWGKIPQSIKSSLPGSWLTNQYALTQEGEIVEITVVWVDKVSKVPNRSVLLGSLESNVELWYDPE